MHAKGRAGCGPCITKAEQVQGIGLARKQRGLRQGGLRLSPKGARAGGGAGHVRAAGITKSGSCWPAGQAFDFPIREKLGQPGPSRGRCMRQPAPELRQGGAGG